MSTSIDKHGIAHASGSVGANMAKNSLVNIAPTSSYNIANFDLTSEVVSGTKYTLTIKGTIGDSKQFGLWMGGGYTSLGFLTGDAGIFTLTFTGPSTIGGNGSRTRINIYAYPSNNTNLSSIEWLKLEQGEVSTAWISATTDTIYTGSTCGFSELGKTRGSIAKECMFATQFYEI